MVRAGLELGITRFQKQRPNLSATLPPTLALITVRCLVPLAVLNNTDAVISCTSSQASTKRGLSLINDLLSRLFQLRWGLSPKFNQ